MKMLNLIEVRLKFLKNKGNTLFNNNENKILILKDVNGKNVKAEDGKCSLTK